MVTMLAFSPDGTRIASASWDRTIKIWDTGMGALRHTLKGHSDYVIAVAVSRDGVRIVSGSRDKTVKIWNAGTGALQQALEGHSHLVSAVAFSPDGTQVASGSDDSTVKIWDANTGALQQTLDVHGDCVRAVAFSLDGVQIETNIGIFQLNRPDSTISPDNKVSTSPDLQMNNHWISMSGQDMLWLPSAIRTDYSDSHGNAICLGCPSGRVFCIHIRLPT